MKKSSEKQCYYENYPLSFLLVSNLFQIAIYVIGAIILYHLGIFFLILYLIYVLFLEFRVMKKSCINCYYYGKYCSFGKGKIASVLFKKGNKDFAKKEISWKDILPDFLVSIIPILIGIILLTIQLSWLILISIVMLLVLTFAGNALVRGNLACKFCKQRKLGCPAERLFNKGKNH